MLFDAARTAGARQAYVCVPADNHHLRQAVEEEGLAHSCTLIRRNALGRTTRWSATASTYMFTLSLNIAQCEQYLFLME
jgi:hypothetical protein